MTRLADDLVLGLENAIAYVRGDSSKTRLHDPPEITEDESLWNAAEVAEPKVVPYDDARQDEES